MGGSFARLLIACAGVLTMSTAAAAQTGTSSIAGVVRDSSGGMLSGVIVAASSPALIERDRWVITDDQGQYKILELRPGVYTVTFTLGGFNTVRREGIELTADFTAPINVEMKVGAIEETITVTGESPVVDTQTVTQRTVMTREVLDAVPTGRNIQAVGILIPGTSLLVGGGNALSVDVGGSGGLQQSPLAYHGANDSQQQVDGMRLNNLCGAGQYSGNYWNDGMIQEISYVTSEASAEASQGGIRVNMIPKEGGNEFRGTVFGNYTDSGFQKDNFNGTLASRGLRSTGMSRIIKIWDFNPSFGGPIKPDRLWFFTTYRRWGVDKTVADSFYESDPARQAIDDGHIDSRLGRLTWQINDGSKISGYFDRQDKVRGHWGIAATVSPEASAIQATPLSYTSAVKYLSTIGDRLLFDGGYAIYYQEYDELYQPNVTPTTFATQELSNGRWSKAWNAGNFEHYSTVRSYVANLSYVTGSHAFKTGFNLTEGPRKSVVRFTGDLTMRTQNGQPVSVVLRNTPRDARETLKADMGFFVQDRWTVKRVTFSGGVRVDYFNSEVPGQFSPAGQWVQERRFAAIKDVPKWYDVNPRMGIAYDVFGNGKTAIKTHLSRFVNGLTVGFATNQNPLGNDTDVRTWSDRNGDGLPQANELGPTNNRNFGLPIVTQRPDDDVREGWFKRPYNWEYSVAIQQEIVPRVAASFSFHRRWFGNFAKTDNLLRTPADYDRFTIVNPMDASEVITLYDARPGGSVNNVTSFAKKFGADEEQVYTGFDVTVNARFGSGGLVQGGMTAGRTADRFCTAIDNPGFFDLNAFGTTRFCDVRPPFNPQFKLVGASPLPWGLGLSGTMQIVRGPEIRAIYAVTSAVAQPTLGRPLSGGSLNVDLIPRGTQYGDTLKQLDLRLTRRFSLGGVRTFQLMADLYNVFNNAAVYRENQNFALTSSQWRRPIDILQGRLFKMGAQLDF